MFIVILLYFLFSVSKLPDSTQDSTTVEGEMVGALKASLSTTRKLLEGLGGGLGGIVLILLIIVVVVYRRNLRSDGAQGANTRCWNFSLCRKLVKAAWLSVLVLITL